MWPVYTVITYFVLALLIPVGWALGRVWRKARQSRNVTCPWFGASATIALDPCFAVRMHARGDNELKVLNCARWPERNDCGQQCLTQIGAL
jgi:hypothetical protein